MALGSRYKKPAPEKRTDVYFNLDDPALGLKFRATKSRLELKIRTCSQDIYPKVAFLDALAHFFI